MSKGVSVFIEYHIKKADIYLYEDKMKNVLPLLADFGAKEVKWFLASKQKNTYIEQFVLPTESHYYALKKLRTSKDHSIFGELNKFIDGGTRSISFWVFKKCS